MAAERRSRRADLRIYEAVFHFNLYMFLSQFLQPFGGQVYPEFPTGNGKIDLIISDSGTCYGLELKFFSPRKEFEDALLQAAAYGKQLELTGLVIFVESIDESNRCGIGCSLIYFGDSSSLFLLTAKCEKMRDSPQDKALKLLDRAFLSILITTQHVFSGTFNRKVDVVLLEKFDSFGPKGRCDVGRIHAAYQIALMKSGKVFERHLLL